jgi:hypothetical protein
MKHSSEYLSRSNCATADRVCVTEFSALKDMSIQAFAKQEKHQGPLTSVLHARFPEPIVSFVKTTALVEGVSDSTVLRFALEQWATAQGFSEHCS